MEGAGPVLWVAACEGNIDCIRKLLLGGGVNLEVKSGALQCTSLHIAAKGGHLMVVLSLLDHGADVFALDRDGWSAAHYASFGGHVSTLLALIHNGANVSATDLNGISILMLAAYNGNNTISELLLYKGAILHTLDINGNTALHHAAVRNHKNIVKLFIAHGDVLHTKLTDITLESLATSHRHHTQVVAVKADEFSPPTSNSSTTQRCLHHIFAISPSRLIPVLDMIVQKHPSNKV